MISPEEFCRSWGRLQLAPVPAEALEGVAIPEPAKRFLAEAGLPLDVEGLALTFVTDRRGLRSVDEILEPETPRPPEPRRLRRLGSNDVGVLFCLDETRQGRVVAVSLDEPQRVVLVNSSVAHLAECLLTYRRVRGASLDETDAAYAARLRQALSDVDAVAIEAQPSWWGTVVEEAGYGFF
jgi:hypothetical protein